MTYIIGICGGSGSGKTFFRKCFLEHFKPGEITLLSQDNYYYPLKTKTKKENLLYNFDLPEALDQAAFLEDIQRLIQGKTIYKQEYTFHNPKLKPRTLEIPSSPIVIIEGLFILHDPAINALLDYKVFMQASGEVALARRIKRDYIERGYTQEEVRYKWTHQVLPAFEQYLLPYKHTCNQIIENSTDDPENIRQHARDIALYLRSYFFYT